MGSMYAATLFLGVQNSSSVQPVVAVERTVFYRERAVGMYSAIPYAFGQVVIEIPYVFVQSAFYGIIVYAMIGFEWTAAKFFCVSQYSGDGTTGLAWTLYGLVASQFGDIQTTLTDEENVEQFLNRYLGFKHDFLGVVAAVIIALPVMFALTFALVIKTFNFQRR
ncbi:hypothetical protein K7X08_030333 [Anisodus acutangulus]|uniref:ABC-2 type transporter transmembrane domain-containing protein n=1 Tax=Anisodus acutangulus TaxID=402998 RepID=A0A9Q1R505_9SOLA|nr:hypothetical protein K7X08_030333 [Anisodus acutangulus]